MPTPYSPGTWSQFCRDLVFAAYGDQRPRINFISSDVSTSATSLSLSLDQSVFPVASGEWIALGLEKMLVTDVNPAAGTNTVTVNRSINPTGAESHTTTTDAMVQVGWRWFLSDVWDYAVEEINSWPEGLYLQSSTTVSIPGAEFQGTATFTRLRHILRAIWTDSDGYEHRLPAPTFHPTSPSGDTGTVTFPKTIDSSTRTVTIFYAQDIDTSAVDFYTDTITSLIPARWVDILRHGVMWRLLTEREAQRVATDTQPTPRQAREVPVLSSARAAANHKAIRDDRIAEEVARLISENPIYFR